MRDCDADRSTLQSDDDVIVKDSDANRSLLHVESVYENVHVTSHNLRTFDVGTNQGKNVCTYKIMQEL